MGLETGTYIDSLVATNPTSGDVKSEGDDHLRLIKSTIKATFAGVTGAVTPTHTELNYVDGVTSAIQTQMDLKAPLASPTLTGTPVAPTASAEDNSTQLATTAYVDESTTAATYPAASGNSGKFLTNDGTVAAWVNAGSQNLIINGNFDINQRVYISAATLATTVFGHDRWKAGSAGGDYSFATVENVTTVTIASGKSLIQVVEGLSLQSDTYTLSWTGTATGKIGAGDLSASGVTGVAVGGTDLNIEFGPGTLSKVALTLGDSIPTIEPRSYGEELALCERYYQTGTEAKMNYAFYHLKVSDGKHYPSMVRFTTTMAGEPTVTLGTLDDRSFDTTTIAVDDQGVNGFKIDCTADATNDDGYYSAEWTADAEL